MMTVAGKKNLSGFRKCSREEPVCSLFCTLESREECKGMGGCCMKAIGGRQGGRSGEIARVGEKGKRRGALLWGWVQDS